MKYQTKEALARAAIELYIFQGKVLVVRDKDIPRRLCQKAACFVTVYVDGELRGCIGTHLDFEPLYQNIVRNALEATFDPRFLPIKENELSKLKVEVSLLTPLKKLAITNQDKLLEYLTKHKPGLLLEYQGRRGIFLPQVWRELPLAADFLSHLCLKAGLPLNTWREKPVTLRTFRTWP